MLSIETSSSTSDFAARRLEHLRSRHLTEAQVSTSRGESTVAERAYSHRQSALERAIAASNELMLLRSMKAREATSMARIAVSVGSPFGFCLHTEGFGNSLAVGEVSNSEKAWKEDPNCPKYFPAIAIKMLSIETSSSTSDFAARRLEHLRSRHLTEAQVSTSRGESTVAERAYSHRQSALERAIAASNELMLLRSMKAREATSMARIAVSVGSPFGFCLHTEGFGNSLAVGEVSNSEKAWKEDPSSRTIHKRRTNKHCY
ncbi:hypothetical protein IEQ34_017976 [Dendrobium chrysotoxum]|uniref:Uncharacterized protein n=1 Tax=Dendrobium chrysotoxum TaxID=161865 RepID=A0AAV7GCY2_DENCH|nr:hypothetical protein IEQ34_017976 [Dendrobium chrysotoxum]